MLHLINQPFNGQLGTILKEKLLEKKYQYFVIVSAFAKNSGVLRLKDSIQEFRIQGGKIDAFIGLDAQGTSYEAVVNLFTLVDNLYIVHDSNPARTFHSKIYLFTNNDKSNWMAVGSNNLTGGGLWTNFESATIVEKVLEEDNSTVGALEECIKLIETYKESNCNYSFRINDISDLDKLLEDNLLRHEIYMQIDAAKKRREASKTRVQSYANHFGTYGKVQIPRVKREGPGKIIKVKDRNNEITSLMPITPTDNSEKMWFETRAMTGGSRNILDLSMLGTLTNGNAAGTRYETDQDSRVLGSVVFFDVDPTNVSEKKVVTINYRAADYVGCTIKLHQEGKRPNGSWRIQLKGETESGEKLTSAEEGEWLVRKIIVLEKIRTDYYVMSVLPEANIEDLIMESIFVARNGSSPAAKQYGLLDI